MSIITIDHLDMVFGPHPNKALELIDRGLDRASIKQKSRQTVVIRGASLTIEEGEIFTIIGHPGSGKSTVLRAIIGLLPVTRGTIRLSIPNGPAINLVKADQETWREIRTKHITMVFQKFALFPWKNVFQNVAFGLELADISKDELQKRVQQCLRALGLDAWSKQFPHELSLSMQLRVGLARALVTDASIVLMDDPFSLVDPSLKNHLQKELLSLCQSFKKTIVFATSDFHEALKISNKIAVMHEGTIVEIARPEELIKEPKTAIVKQMVAQSNYGTSADGVVCFCRYARNQNRERLNKVFGVI